MVHRKHMIGKEQRMAEMRARNLIGLQVIAQGGRNVGAVKDVLVDTGTWRVAALSVRLTKEAADDLSDNRRGVHTWPLPTN